MVHRLVCRVVSPEHAIRALDDLSVSLLQWTPLHERSARVQDPEELYLELAEHVRTGLVHVDPYFKKLADGMEAWIAAWRQLNPEGIPDIK